MRMFPLLLSLLHASHVSVTEVCPAARLHVRRILSLSIKWSLDPPTPHLKRRLHNSTRISGLGELYSPSSSCCSLLSLSLLSIPPDTHFLLTRHMLEAHLWSGTHKSRHTHTLQRLLFKLVCSWTHSSLRIFPIRILAEVNMLRYCNIRAEQALPVASPEKCTFPVQFRWWWPSDSMFLHAMCKRWILKLRAWRCCSYSTCHVTSANRSCASHLWKQLVGCPLLFP